MIEKKYFGCHPERRAFGAFFVEQFAIANAQLTKSKVRHLKIRVFVSWVSKIVMFNVVLWCALWRDCRRANWQASDRDAQYYWYLKKQSIHRILSPIEKQQRSIIYVCYRATSSLRVQCRAWKRTFASTTAAVRCAATTPDRLFRDLSFAYSIRLKRQLPPSRNSVTRARERERGKQII